MLSLQDLNTLVCNGLAMAQTLGRLALKKQWDEERLAADIQALRTAIDAEAPVADAVISTARTAASQCLLSAPYTLDPADTMAAREAKKAAAEFARRFGVEEPALIKQICELARLVCLQTLLTGEKGIGER